MRGDESASTPTTPPLPIKTMFLASVTPSGPHSPQHLLTTAIHTHSAVSPNQHTTATCEAPAPLRIPLQSMSSHHMLSRGLVGGSREAERKATCTLCISGRPASVTRHTQEPERTQTGALSACLGWWSWEIKGV